MKQKKLMLLGGMRYLLPVIEVAHKLGAYVITADYSPDVIAHNVRCTLIWFKCNWDSKIV